MNKIRTLFIEFQKKSLEIAVLERQLNRLKNEQKELQTKLKNELKDDRPYILRVKQGKVVRQFKVDSSGEMFEV
jgi:predicted phage-related endonuclease